MKKTMISVIVFTLLTIGTALASPEAPTLNPSTQFSTVGIVDMNRISQESPKFKVLQEQLNQKGKEFSDELVIEKKNLIAAEYKIKEEEVYNEFVKIKQEMESNFEVSIHQALEKVAREKNLTMILYKNGVAWGGIDVTQDVINAIE